MATMQPGILPNAGPFALYVTLNVENLTDAVKAQLGHFHRLIADINDQYQADLCATLSFGQQCWQQLYQGTSFDTFKPLGAGKVTAPATEADVLIHIHSTRHDLHFLALRKFLAPIADVVTITDETYGYRYLDSRDMTDFVDGTENPKEDAQRQEVAAIASGDLAGGSFVMLQRFEHNLPAWNKMGIAQQEAAVGRTKADSIELDDVPNNSHVGRVDIKEKGKGLKLVRHSLPYGSVSGPHGLLFIAYCNTQHNFKQMLESMYGEVDGVTDRLLDFTTAVTGGYYFAPSNEMLAAILAE
ncbi:Dyp-type peroxidase [Thaumasiovibrio subtropicus]|uniref:Dyp-type peroxidase n=1 Tax=Thaumasiovibrio subtropicus TaxID=1891207 RepID=UPI000B3555F7|nr:Dyp-type peroxidase [Thaumasiovibrio subtropicus]